MPAPVLLHFGGAGTYTAAFMVTVAFVLIFVFSFGLGRLPAGTTRWSREWLTAWLRASLPRLAAAGIFAGGLFLASSLSGGSGGGGPAGSGACDGPLPPVTTQAVTQARIQAAIDAMIQVSETARAGDGDGARTLFYGDGHLLTHDIDRPLREADPVLAKDLCESMVALETQFAGPADTRVVAREAEATAGALGQARAVLGLGP